jgi:FAD/FMN-containing dehydrogenase
MRIDALRTDADIVSACSTGQPAPDPGNGVGTTSPKYVADVQDVVRDAADRGIPIVPSGAGTGLTGPSRWPS